ncbi:MAG: sugar phosphate isomerase/epimerase [Firmicutes bacterium]|nr:sugar phosphate isomerase/epimerase [Bacillota bacterium]
MSKPIVGAQLYTTRKQMQSPKDIEKTLTRVAAIGYEYIQCSGFQYDAAWLRALCGRLGLKVTLTHGSDVLGDTQTVIENHKILGCPYVGLGGMPGQYRCADGARKFLRDFRPAMEALREAGLKFQYHNHAWEFARAGGERFYDVLVSESDPALMGFTLDTYWAHFAGMDVPGLVRGMKGRLDVCHYKDMVLVNDKEQRFAAIGDGNMNFPAIVEAFAYAGTQYAFIEQDDCYGKDPVEELARSWRYLEGI